MYSWVVLLAISAALLSCRTPDVRLEGSSESDLAETLAQEILIADGHIDLPYRLRTALEKDGTSEDVTLRTPGGDFDWPRARAGGLDAPFMSIYVPSKYQSEPGRSKAVAEELIAMVEGLVHRAPDKFGLARRPEEIRRLKAQGRIALPMGIENGSALEDDLENVAYFHKKGIRYITLAHDKDNLLSDSSYDESHTWGGLSEFGRSVVREMAQVGIMVDVSHLTDPAIRDVLAVSQVPVIASHSSCRHFTPGWARNLPDELIVAIAEKRGVILINFGSSFLSETSRQHFKARREAVTAFATSEDVDPLSEAVEVFLHTYDQQNPMVLATVEDVADHIDHVVKLVGVDHVGFGSDFDGVGPTTPKGLKDASMYPNLILALLRRDYSQDDIRKIAAENLFRVWDAVESYATLTQAH